MQKLIHALRRDEAGFIASAELVLIATIVGLGMIVGLSEVSAGINSELADCGAAFGSINQTFCYRTSCGSKDKCKSQSCGSEYQDTKDDCDGGEISCSPAQPEAGGRH